MSTAETRHLRILVVDDDPEILALARDILGAEGYSVLEGRVEKMRCGSPRGMPDLFICC